MGSKTKKWQRALYQPGLPLGEGGQRVTACREHIELSKNAAKEGMVLLKNEGNVLPLKKGMKIALFGKGSIDYVKGGGGSGDVTVSYIRNLCDGFEQMREYVSMYEELNDFYSRDIKHQYARGVEPGMTVEPELPEELCLGAANYADVAIISICRFSGEGWDRKSSYDKIEEENPLFEEGDFYLSNAEKQMVEKVKQHFDKIVVVMNVGGMVDTTWLKENEKISSVLMAWQGGMEGGLAAAELLCGVGNPSGKLSDTYAKKLEDYPSSYNFHESDRYVDYIEDIYVGYRYFETIPGAYKKVNYPFGFGLSYTRFAWEIVRTEVKKEKYETEVWVRVTNVGDLAGKEVIQIYGSAPQGKLGKAAKTLVAFEKTRLLQVGESQLLHLNVDMKLMASFDDMGKIEKSAYILEAGEYRFYVGTSVRDEHFKEFSYQIETTLVLEKLSSKIAPTSLEKRMLADGSYEKLPLSQPNDPDECGLLFEEKEPLDGLTPVVRTVDSVCLWKTPHKEGIRTFEEVADGKMTIKEFLAQMSDEEVAHLLGGQPNTGVANTFGMGNMPEYKMPNIMTADGPAGLRIAPECGVNTTAWPCATLLASTWNSELLYQVGEAGAKEVKENNIAVWLTPAVNIHRSPLCGRNFEYYSEDPLLTGKMAAAMVEGIQSQHIGVAVKHFALNNKETNRKNSDSRVSERAAREIYLKAFEYIVKNAHPWAVMTSYNIINGHRASENKELIQGILREEWGYDGMVTSDWWTFGEQYKEVKAGNDIKMALGFPKRLLEAVKAGLLTRAEMEKCAEKVLELILKID